MAAEQPTSSRRRRRFLRAAAAAAIALVILAGAIVVAVQIVLSTDLPRRLVVDALEKSTGLEVEAASLTTGWTGRAVLKDVVFRLPLDKGPLATAPVVRARHTQLLGLVAGVELHELEIERPTLHVYENDRGQWSVVRAVEAIARAQPREGADPSAPELPRIAITDGVAEITRPGRAPVTVPVSLRGDNDGALTWAFAASVGDSRVEGRLSRVDFAHDLDVSLRGLEPVLGLWMEGPPPPLTMSARWSGSPGDGGLDGRLVIRSLRVSEAAAAGSASVAIANGRVTIRPGMLEISAPQLPRGPLVLSRGVVSADLERVSVRALRAEAPGLIAEVAGEWDILSEAGTLAADFSGELADRAVTHHGRAEVRARMPGAGRRSIAASVESIGTAAGRQWRSSAELSIAGPSWDSLEGRLTAPTLVVTGGERPLDLSGVMVGFTSRWPDATLTGLNVPGVRLTRAAGTVDLSTREWSLSLDAEGLEPERFHIRPPRPVTGLAVSFRGSGDAGRAEFSRLRITGEGLAVVASGTYEPTRPEPLAASADLRIALPEEAAPAGAAASLLRAGTIVGELDVAGGLEPLLLRARGLLTAQGLRVSEGERGVLEPVRVQVRAQAGPDGASLESDSFSLLGGEWKLAAGYTTGDTDVGLVRLECQGVPLDRVARLAAPSVEAAGKLRAAIDIRLPDLDTGRTELDGRWSVGEASAAGVAIERGEGRVSVRGGRVRLEEMSLARGDALMSGSVEFQAADPRNVALDLTTSRWPVSLEDAGLSLLVDASAKLNLDAVARSARGTLSVNADAAAGDRPIGPIRVDAALDGRTVEARSIHARVLGGTVEGSATVPLDNWPAASADLKAGGLDLGGLGAIWDWAAPVRGVVSGTVTVAPSRDPRALAPLRIDVSLKTEGGALRGMSFGDATLVGYAGPRRFMLDRSEVDVAGGRLGVWSRLSMHDNEPFVHLSVDGQGLDLDQLIRAADPEIGPTPGRISGRAVVGGYIDTPHRAYGEAELEIQESDMARVPVITQLYGLLNLGAGSAQPRGEGFARLRLEGDALELARLYYFNRGIDVVASATVHDIWQGPASPVSGFAAGAARPLRDSQIPMGADLDRILGAVFADAVSVSIGGTLADREVGVVPFASVQGMFGRLIGRPRP